MKRFTGILLFLLIPGFIHAQGSQILPNFSTLNADTIVQTDSIPTVDWNASSVDGPAVPVEDEGTIVFVVFDLKPVNVGKDAAVLITEQLRAELLSSNNFTCIDKVQMLQILEANNVRDSGCVTNDCAVKMGRLLNVTYAIVGTVGSIGEMHSLHLRVIDTKTGKINFAINKNCLCPIEAIFTSTIKEAVGEITNTIMEKRYADLHIVTDPADAEVYLNYEKVGITPCQITKLKPGTHSITLKLDTYKTITKSLVLQGGKTGEITESLVHSQHYLDSLNTLVALKAEQKAKKEAEKKAAAEKAEKKKKVKIISRIALGTLTAGLAAGGYYMDMQMNDKLEEKNALYNNYLSSTSQKKAAQNKQEYDRAHSDGQDLVTYRTLFYVAAGCTAAGFGVTFFF